MRTRLLSLGIVLCLALIPNAQAQEDPRFQITLHVEQGQAPSLPEQVRQALPILWKRIVTQKALPNIPNDIKPMSLLLRVHPQADGSIIVFNPSRVWSILEKRKIAHIRKIPMFHLQIQLNNRFGNSMQQSEEKLLHDAQRQAKVLGMILTDNAPLLAMHIQWLDDIQAQLSVRGQSRLPEFSETRTLDMGNPFAHIQRWVLDTLIRARDAYVWSPQTATNHQPSPIDSAQDLKLVVIHIEQEAPLSEQVALEQALQHDPRVAQLIPVYLNHQSRQYTLTLKKPDDSWIASWFAQRGMTATPDAQGWLIQ